MNIPEGTPIAARFQTNQYAKAAADYQNRIRKESATMQEARSSFNFKFYLDGFECQFTVRDDNPGEALKLAEAAINDIKRLGAKGRVTQPGSNGNGSKPKEQLPTLCPSCKLEGMPIQGNSQKNGGRAFTALKCPQCQDFIKGTFRWA